MKSAKTLRQGVIGVSLLFLSTGCATPVHERLEKLHTGMDKGQVLDLVGNPKRTIRKDSSDVWTFVYYQGDRRFERDVRFTNGHVSHVGAPLAVSREADADAVTSDYENLVNEAESNRKPKKP